MWYSSGSCDNLVLTENHQIDICPLPAGRMYKGEYYATNPK